jgi:hypothetical protein
MRTLVLIAAVAAGLALPAAAVSAGQPTRTPAPELVATAPAGTICPFTLSTAPVINNAYLLTFPTEANGDIVQLITGSTLQQFTDDETGKSIETTITGNSRIVAHPDGSHTITDAGRAVFGPFPPPLQGVIFAGRVVTEVSPAGETTIVSHSGTVVVDICAALA